jgi:hypothetical protein
LIEIAPLENHQNTYSHIKFLLKLLILEDFPNFDIEDDFELSLFLDLNLLIQIYSIKNMKILLITLYFNDSTRFYQVKPSNQR